MGNATVKPVAATAAPAVAAAVTRRCYALSFVATASGFGEPSPLGEGEPCGQSPLDGGTLSEEEMVEALDQLGDPETWLHYLVSATRAALELEGDEEDPHLCGVGAAFVRGTEPQSYRGSVNWNGPACDYERLKSSLDWFIGDRMSQYGIGDDDAGWRMFIEVKELKEKAD